MELISHISQLVSYCESTNLCRHVSICHYFGENIVPQCYYACDFHKDPEALVKAKEEGLASEEWCSTQRVNVAEEDEYD
jgi:superfamily II DNA helicase RecQ